MVKEKCGVWNAVGNKWIWIWANTALVAIGIEQKRILAYCRKDF